MRTRIISVLALTATLMAADAALACGPSMADPGLRFLNSDYVVVATVQTVEKEAVSVSRTPGSAPMKHHVLVLEIETFYRGLPGISHVRVAVPLDTDIPHGKAVFCLNDHPQETFCVLQGGYVTLADNSTGFERQVATFETISRLHADLKAGLDSKDAEERLLSASLVITENRLANQRRQKNGEKHEAVDAERSKHVLSVLAQSEWTARTPRFGMTAVRLFALAQLAERDDWKGVKDTRPMANKAQPWLRENLDRFVIRFGSK